MDLSTILGYAVWLFILFIAAVVVLPSIRKIGPTEVGLVTKRFAKGKLTEDSPVAFIGEAGYQSDLLMPGLRWKFWIIYSVEKHPWVQIPAGEIGVVIAQVGDPLPIGAKSAVYKSEFKNFTDLRGFVAANGQKGVQRPVLPPGSLVPIHPVGFLIITKRQVFGVPVSTDLNAETSGHGRLSCETFGLKPAQLELVMIEPVAPQNIRSIDYDQESEPGNRRVNEPVDMIGIVTTFEGDPLPSGDIAGRLGGFDDIKDMEGEDDTIDNESTDSKTDADIIDIVLGSKNDQHNNYQDFQAFLDNGGKIGLQHDPLLYGAYALNPFLVSVERVPMLVVDQGEVAVIKSYVGLTTQDTSGEEFKFGSLVRPGHRGIWQEPLRTGKFPVNPRCYQAVIVPTAILTLNWAEATSKAHDLDKGLDQIEAKSREGFIFKIDLQVQIHVADTKAPKVISMVGTMQNLVNEVLQAAVGNHFRDKLQSMPAIKFIETRQQVQEEAMSHIQKHLDQYKVETRGVYIQDVILPSQLVAVLTNREIANQEIETFKKQEQSQQERIKMENAKGVADKQSELASSKVGIEIKMNNANARKAEANGEATYISETGKAKGAEVEAIGLARAKAYQEQVRALGPSGTAIVNVTNALAESKTRFVPDVLVAGGGGSGSLDGLAGTLINYFNRSQSVDPVPDKKVDASEKETENEGPIAPSVEKIPSVSNGDDRTEA
ncbi:MAG: SPFH domain-containing protein [Patescibacteria group bacterium]